MRVQGTCMFRVFQHSSVRLLLDEDIETLVGWHAVIGSMGSMQSNGMQPIAAVDFWVTAGIHCYTHSLCPQRSPLLVFMACLVIWPKPEFLRSWSPWSNTTWAWVAVSHCWSRQNRKVPKWTTRVPHFSACPHYITRTMPPSMNWVSSLFTAGI